MSNAQVGNVYSRIIDEVITQCRGPFEEEGASAEVLNDFKKAWQTNLSSRRVADMPWDPKAPAAPLPAQQAPQARPQYLPQAPPNGLDIKPHIKPEPNDLANLGNVPAYTHVNPNLAAQNAQQALRDRFGERADASIQQLDARMATEAPHGVKRPAPQSSPTQDQFEAKRHMAEYNQGMNQQAQQRLTQLQGAQRQPTGIVPPVRTAQTDGAADWKQMVAERRALAEDASSADMSIAQMVAARQRAEEGGGVMQPHSKQVSRSKKTSNSLTAAQIQGRPSAAPASRPSGYDGVDDDEDEDVKPDIDDADAINSELDDDEEENIDDDDDEENGEIMVCTYEKVARVKNKWKCTLKDGILVTGGKEYIFAKATGEFEWCPKDCYCKANKKKKKEHKSP